MAIRRPKDWVFLYVPDSELEEALYLGAVRVEGDSRLAIPNPLPPGVTQEAFERWQTPEACYRWCYALVQGILSDLVAPDSESDRRRLISIELDMAPRPLEGSLERNKRHDTPTMTEIMAQLGKSAGECDRVYLYPTPEEAHGLRTLEGVHWDRRKRAYYATRGADLNKLFKYMTPGAQKAWQGARTATRATDWLVQEMARAEVARRTGTAAAGGGPAKTIPGESAKAARRKSQARGA